MKIKLERTVAIESFNAIIEFGRNVAREDIIAVLMLARENNNYISAELICNNLLRGRPKAMGELIIKRLKYYDLFTDDNQLTELGLSSIESKNVYIPERGVFKIWCTQDPLLPQILLDLKPVEIRPLHQEIRSEKQQKNNEQDEKVKLIENLPEWLLSLKRKIVNLLGPSRDQIKILDIEKKGELLNNMEHQKLQAHLTINEEDGLNLTISGLYNVERLKPPRLIFNEVWRTLLGNKAKDWDESVFPPKLRFTFEELNERERNSFCKDVEFFEPNLPNYGTFDKTVVNKVPIGPKTKDDAQKWAEWLLIKKINDYLFKEDYRQLTEHIILKFPEFEVELPSQQQMAQILRETFMKSKQRKSSTYWYVHAPLDLNPGGKITE